MAGSSKKQPVLIDKRSLHAIRDIANQIWQRTRAPNANLIMFEALVQYLDKQGVELPFTVKLEEGE